MNYYQETTLINGDKSLYEIWSIVYTQLHIALADLKNHHDINNIGVSFPDYKYEVKSDGREFAMLGNKLRVFAHSKEDLDKLDLKQWLEKVNTDKSIRTKWKLFDSFDINDYVHIKRIAEIGDKATGYVSVHRYRFKPIEIQAQTLADKLKVSYDEAMVTVAKRKKEMAVPFIQMHSQTNNSNYRLSVLQLPSDKAKSGSFNVYGMNGMRDTVTVPQW
jgi:CRISPR-associated endonuclease Csy4